MKTEEIQESSENNIIKYVCGFMFDLDHRNIALIKKNKPEWQKGFLNGIGGKIEKNETPDNAMIREFKEETGYDTFYRDWRPFAEILQDNKWHVYFYYAIGNLDMLETTESEEIIILPLQNLFESNALPSVKWLVNLCLDKTHSYTVSMYNKE